MKVYEVKKWNDAIRSEVVKTFSSYSKAYSFILKELNPNKSEWNTMIIKQVIAHNGKYWESDYFYTEYNNFCNFQWNKEIKKLMKKYKVVQMCGELNKSDTYSINVVEVE